MKKTGVAVLIVAAALLFGGCGAKQIQFAVDAEDAVYRAVVLIDAAGDRLAGCVLPADAAQPEACVAFNRAMRPAITAARAFNWAVQKQDVASVSDLVTKLVAVKVAVEQLPQTVDRDKLLAEVLAAIARAASGFVAAGGGA